MFVQIGNRAFGIAHIVYVEFAENGDIYIWSTETEMAEYMLQDKEAAAFLE